MKFPKQVKALIFNTVLDYTLFYSGTEPFKDMRLTENTLTLKDSSSSRIKFYKLIFKDGRFEELVCHRSPYTGQYEWRRTVISDDITVSDKYGKITADQFNQLATILAYNYALSQNFEAE